MKYLTASHDYIGNPAHLSHYDEILRYGIEQCGTRYYGVAVIESRVVARTQASYRTQGYALNFAWKLCYQVAHKTGCPIGQLTYS